MNEFSEKQIDEARLKRELRQVNIPESLESSLIKLTGPRAELEAQSIEEQGTRQLAPVTDSKTSSKNWKSPWEINWMLVAGGVLGILLLLAGLLYTAVTTDTDNGTLVTESDGTRETEKQKNGTHSTKQSANRIRATIHERIEELDRLQAMVNQQWQPFDHSLDRSLTSANRQTTMTLRQSNERSSLSSENIPSILYYTAAYSDRIGSDESSVEKNYRSIVDRFPDSEYAELAKAALNRN